MQDNDINQQRNSNSDFDCPRDARRINKMHVAILVLVLLVAGLLRLWAINWGSPHLLYSDELLIVRPAVRLWQEKTLDPSIYLRPNHISIYLNAIVFQSYSFVRFHAPLTETFSRHEIDFYVLARILVALFGTMSVFVAWLIGREYAPAAGLIFAVLFAVFPVYVEQSHYVNPDITLTFFVLLVIFYALAFLREGAVSLIIMMSIFTGMATSEKYPGVLGLLLVFVVICIVRRQDVPAIIRGVLLSVAVFVMTIFVCAPFVLLRYKETLNAILGEARPTHLGADGLGYVGNIMFYLQEFFSLTGLIMLVFFLGGSVLAVIREKTRAIPLFFGVVYMLVLAKVPLHWVRWALPIYVSLLCLAGYAQFHTWHWSKNYFWRRSGPWMKMIHPLITVIVALPIGGMLLGSLSVTRIFSLPDTRVQALHFCASRQITPENSIYEWYTPFTMRAFAGTSQFFKQVEQALNGEKVTFEYIIVSSYNYGRYYSEEEQYPYQIGLYERIRHECTLIKAFSTLEGTTVNATKMMAFNPEYRWFPIFRVIEKLLARTTSVGQPPMEGPEILIYRIRDRATNEFHLQDHNTEHDT